MRQASAATALIERLCNTLSCYFELSPCLRGRRYHQKDDCLPSSWVNPDGGHRLPLAGNPESADSHTLAVLEGVVMRIMRVMASSIAQSQPRAFNYSSVVLDRRTDAILLCHQRLTQLSMNLRFGNEQPFAALCRPVLESDPPNLSFAPSETHAHTKLIC